MKVSAIVQARMGSTRLPGKVLMDLGGDTVLARVVGRLRRAKTIDEVVIATSDQPSDDVIVRECDRLGVNCFRGSEEDVLDRYLRAAEQYESDIIVRVTSDCPLIDAGLVDQVVQLLFATGADLACNEQPRTFPRGLDAEAFAIATLRKADKIAARKYEREHVTPIVYERPDLFHIVSVQGEKDFSRFRWTLDTAEDLRLIREIYAHFDNQDDFDWRAALDLMQLRPELAEINAHVVQKPVYQVVNTA